RRSRNSYESYLKGEPNDSMPCPFDFGGRLSKDQPFLAARLRRRTGRSDHPACQGQDSRYCRIARTVDCRAAPVVTRAACPEVPLPGVSRLAAGLDEVLDCGPARCAVSDHGDAVVPVLEQAAGQLRDRCRGTDALARGQLTRAYSLLLSLGR